VGPSGARPRRLVTTERYASSAGAITRWCAASPATGFASCRRQQARSRSPRPRTDRGLASAPAAARWVASSCRSSARSASAGRRDRPTAVRVVCSDRDAARDRTTPRDIRRCARGAGEHDRGAARR
jgi:hypothetical protein